MPFKLKISVLIFLVFHFAVKAQKTPTKTFLVKGRVTQSFSYCNGARPTEEMMNELAKPKAYAGKVFYIKKGKSNDVKQAVVVKIVSDTAGYFSFELPAGNYVILQTEQLKPLDYKVFTKMQHIDIDKNCLQQWWLKPYMHLEISDKNPEPLHFHFQHRCFVPSDISCLTYTGPMPP